MPARPQVKPTHKPVKDYYAALEAYADQSVAHEGALRSAFQNLLADTARKFGWTLIPELSLDANGHSIRPDGTFSDEFTIERGYWEAKDTADAAGTVSGTAGSSVGAAGAVVGAGGLCRTNRPG